MSLSSENMLKLMAYADGELDGTERDEAEKLLASDPDSIRFVQQLGGLGELVELGYAAKSGKTVAKFDITDAVMASVKPAKVSSLAEARAKKAAAPAPRGNATIGVVIVAALALAASVFFVVQHRTDETPMAKAPATHETASPAAPATTVASTSPAPAGGSGGSSGAGVDVSTVNSPGNSVSVFYLPTANELSTSVVVWVDETGEK